MIKIFLWSLVIFIGSSVTHAELIEAPKFDLKSAIEEERLGSHSKNKRIGTLKSVDLYIQWNQHKKAISLLTEEIPKWGSTATEDIKRACNTLFSLLYLERKHEKHQEKLSSCPDDLQRVWFAKDSRKYLPVIKVAPTMPREAVNNDITGYVIVQYDINKKGRPINIVVIESTNEIFNRPTTKSVKEYHYLPSIVKGEIVEEKGIKTKITFQIQS